MTVRHVAHVIATAGLTGAERHVATLVAALGGELRQTVLAPPGPLMKLLSRECCMAIGLPRMGKWSLAGVRTLARHLREAAPDIVHLHGPRALVLGQFALRSAGRPPAVCTAHELVALRGDFGPARRALYGTAEGWALGRCRRVIAVSRQMEQVICGQYPRLASRVALVLHGIVDPGEVTAEERRQRKAALGLGEEDRLICGVGRLIPEKGQDVLLEAVAALATPAARRTWVFLVGDGPERDRLEALASQRGLKDRLRITGFVSDVRSYSAAADIIVVPSRWPEPLGLVAVEGLAQGSVVVASAAGGLLEVIEDGRTGLLVPPGDAAALCRALEALLGDPERASALRQAARGSYLARFTAERMARETAAVYEAAAGEGADARV